MYQNNSHLKISPQKDTGTDDSFSLIQAAEAASIDSKNKAVSEIADGQSPEISYTCLLIPRFPSHQLRGDLAVYLPQWLEQICISRGWKLELVSIDPEYLQWEIRLNVSVSSNRMVYAIRTETSKFILSSFRRVAQENLFNDFWAPGHLVMLGVRPRFEYVISHYITLVRRQQSQELP